MQRTQRIITPSASIKNVLALPGKQRMAALLGPPRLPRPWVATLSGGVLRWSWYPHFTKHGKRLEKAGGRHQPPELQKPASDLCFRFAQLASGSDEQIRAFAERWGPLNIEPRAEEDLAQWRHYAELAAALLRFSAGQPPSGGGSEADWLTICESTSAGQIDRALLSMAHQRAVLAMAVNTWFAKTRGHRILDVVYAQLQVRPNASNLFGVLVTQIAHVIARSDELAVCAGCHNSFRPKRRLSRGQRQYCNVCRKSKVPQRDAARDWRLRKANGRRK